MNLHPFNEVLLAAQKLHEKGTNCFQQFQCAKCKAKNMIEEPNTFYEVGTCGDCGYVTDIKKDGMNFMAYFLAGEPPK